MTPGSGRGNGRPATGSVPPARSDTERSAAALTLDGARAELEARYREAAAQAEQLEEQAAELEMANQQLQEQQVELEAANEQLREQRAALEAQAVELEARTFAVERATATLALSEERYELAARATRDAIWDRDPATGVVAWSPGAAEAFGYAPDDVRGGAAWWADRVHADDRDRVAAGLRAAVDDPAGATAWAAEYRFRRGDGAYAAVADRGFVARDHAGRAVRVVGAMRDVTAERRARADAEAARAEAEAANRAKSDFLAVMSHELRTPLNAIAGYADLLDAEIQGPVTAGQRGYLARLQRAQQHLLGLINDVLDFARLEAGRVEFRIEAVPLAPLLAGVEELVGPQVGAKRLRFSVGGVDAALAAHADAEKARQVLLNLLTNAVKFTAPGGSVALTCEAEAGRVSVRVRDTGRGIAPEALAHIFDPFVQVDRHLTDASQQGVGLGLAISRDLARGMGGDLTAESTPGVGSTFTLTLPAVESAAE